MLRNARVQMAGVLAVGALLGYLAASGKWNPFSKADASQTAPEAAKARPADPDNNAGQGKVEAIKRGQLQSQISLKREGQEEKATGKKPNIVFIMGDDIGWFQIGAYHRGMMSGKTPHLDKLASQGALFTDYYAEASLSRFGVLPDIMPR